MSEPQYTADGRELVRMPGTEDEDGNPVCPSCACPDLEILGRGRRECRNCGKPFLLLRQHRGPKCDRCDEPLEVTRTGPWKDGRRERLYHCIACHRPKTLVEIDPSRGNTQPDDTGINP